MNIVEIAAGSDDFNILVRLLTDADLVTTVQEADDITVFAPTDAAFGKLAQNLGFMGDLTDEDAVYDALLGAVSGLVGGDPIPTVSDILLYHVAPGARTEPTITGSDSIATLLEGALISPADGALGDLEPDLDNPMIVTPDIQADNGIIQAIDAVLLPLDIPGNEMPDDMPDEGTPTITGLVTNNAGFDQPDSEFDILEAAVVAAGLAGTLDAADADLTVFAPTDAAFIATAQALGFQGTDEASAFDFLVAAVTLLSKGGDPIPLLTQILTYHVSPGTQDSTAVTAATTLDTLQGATLGFDAATTTLVDNDPDLPNPGFVTLDVPASNGIVHVIDGVLLPVDILPSDGSDAVNFIFGTDADGTFEMGLDNDFVDAGGGDDTIAGEEGDDVLLGGAGNDTAIFAGNLADYSIMIDFTGTMIMDNGSAGTGTDFLGGIEALSFADGGSFANDGTVNLAILEGGASLSGESLEMLTELYVAYFDRAPDALGLLFWGNALAIGVSMNEIAELFFDQPETQAKLPDSLTSSEFVLEVYDHVLERAPDDAGRDFWVDALDTGGVTRAEFIVEFLAGARANSDAADDVRTIEDKADIGVSYALINGLNDATNAASVMDAYDRTDAATSKASAQSLIEGFATAAPGSEFTVQLIGLVDDPFAVA